MYPQPSQRTFVPKTEPYYSFLPDFLPTLRQTTGIPSLENIVGGPNAERPIVSFIADGRALEVGARPSDYAALEARLTQYVANIKLSVHGRKYKDTINQAGSKLVDVLGYIDLLATRFTANGEQVRRLKLSVLKQFSEDFPGVAYFFLSESPLEDFYSQLITEAEQQIRATRIDPVH